MITLVSPEKEKDVRRMQRELRRREPIEAASVATAATILASAPPKHVDRGDGLDGVSRRERARAADRPERPRSSKPIRGKGHRKGESPRVVAEAEWTPRPKPAKTGEQSSTPNRNGQGRAGAPARPGRPGAKPGRRPAGAGAARPGRPASGNARRRTR